MQHIEKQCTIKCKNLSLFWVMNTRKWLFYSLNGIFRKCNSEMVGIADLVIVCDDQGTYSIVNRCHLNECHTGVISMVDW